MEHVLHLTKYNEISIKSKLEPWCSDCKFFTKEERTVERWYNDMENNETPSLEEKTISCKNMPLCKNKYHAEVADEKL